MSKKEVCSLCGSTNIKIYYNSRNHKCLRCYNPKCMLGQFNKKED